MHEEQALRHLAGRNPHPQQERRLLRDSTWASYIWHDLVPVLGLYSQNKLIFHCIHDFDKYQVILNLSLYLDIFPFFSLKSIADMVLEYSDKVKKKSWYQKFYRLSRPFHKQTAE